MRVLLLTAVLMVLVASAAAFVGNHTPGAAHRVQPAGNKPIGNENGLQPAGHKPINNENGLQPRGEKPIRNFLNKVFPGSEERRLGRTLKKEVRSLDAQDPAVCQQAAAALVDYLNSDGPQELPVPGPDGENGIIKPGPIIDLPADGKNVEDIVHQPTNEQGTQGTSIDKPSEPTEATDVTVTTDTETPTGVTTGDAFVEVATNTVTDGASETATVTNDAATTTTSAEHGTGNANGATTTTTNDATTTTANAEHATGTANHAVDESKATEAGNADGGEDVTADDAETATEGANGEQGEQQQNKLEKHTISLKEVKLCKKGHAFGVDYTILSIVTTMAGVPGEFKEGGVVGPSGVVTDGELADKIAAMKMKDGNGHLPMPEALYQDTLLIDEAVKKSKDARPIEGRNPNMNKLKKKGVKQILASYKATNGIVGHGANGGAVTGMAFLETMKEHWEWEAHEAMMKRADEFDEASLLAMEEEMRVGGFTPLAPTKENCSFYMRKVKEGKLRLSNRWRTGSYMLNAYCACLNTPNSAKARTIRGYLQHRITQANARGKTMFSTEDIYNDHVLAYGQARCPCGPAPYWGWLGVTNVPMKAFGTTAVEKPLEELVSDDIECKVVEWSIRIMGSCNGCYVGGFWGLGEYDMCYPCTSF